MDSHDLFINRAFVFSSLSPASEEDRVFVESILKQANFEGPIDSVMSIGFTNDYDSYEIKSGDKTFILKFSLDKRCPSIFIEGAVLEGSRNMIAPKLIGFGVTKAGEEISYLVYEKLNAESLKELGRGFLMDNLSSFCSSLRWLGFVEQSTCSELPLFDKFVGRFLEMADISKYFLEDSLESLRGYTDFNKLETILNSLKESIIDEVNTQQDVFNKTGLCHGSLSLDNIFSRKGWFKFSDYDKAFNGNPVLDLAWLVLNLGLNKSAEKDLIKAYFTPATSSYKDDYDTCFSIMSKLFLLELVVLYLQEVYLLGGSREDKILELNEKLAQGVSRFHGIKAFDEHKDFIVKTITEPILGIKAS